MALVSIRKANSTIGAAIVLMLCVTVFAATLFYLLTSPVMSLAFDNEKTDNSSKEDDNQPSVIEQPEWVKGPWSLEQAINDLNANGCALVEKKDMDSIEKAIELDYDGFRKLAIRRRIVYIIVDEIPEALMVRVEDMYYVWTL
jgi:hypothetical protein